MSKYNNSVLVGLPTKTELLEQLPLQIWYSPANPAIYCPVGGGFCPKTIKTLKTKASVSNGVSYFMTFYQLDIF
jgi:hypothetical protein